MDPVVVTFDKFHTCDREVTGSFKAMMLASQIASIEDCHLQTIDETGAKEFHFVCITLVNGTAVNVFDAISDVMQKWTDGLKLGHGIDFDV